MVLTVVGPVDVLVTSRIGEECLRQIAEASPRVRVTDASGLLRAERGGEAAATERLDDLLNGTEVLYGLRLPRDLVERAPRLRWVQVMSAGVEAVLDGGIRESPVVLTNVSGIHATPIAEFVLGLMLMFAKGAPMCFRMKQEREWTRFPPSVLRSQTVGVVGLGSIGREVARLAKCFGMRVMATRRSAKRAGGARNVDMLLPPDQLRLLLAESDYVVLALPLTRETRGLIGVEELRAMKPTAYLINITRGGVVDEGALIRALEEHWLAGAGLDVFAIEPLPRDSRLWDLPNVILSPHISGGMEDYVARATEVFVENLRRYLDGRKLVNVVNKRRGY